MSATEGKLSIGKLVICVVFLYLVMMSYKASDAAGYQRGIDEVGYTCFNMWYEVCQLPDPEAGLLKFCAAASALVSQCRYACTNDSVQASEKCRALRAEAMRSFPKLA